MKLLCYCIIDLGTDLIPFHFNIFIVVVIICFYFLLLLFIISYSQGQDGSMDQIPDYDPVLDLDDYNMLSTYVQQINWT